MQSQWHRRLCDDGWKPETERFWEADPCFYDLRTLKTVLLFKELPPDSGFADVYYWKYGSHELPEYLDAESVEIRRYMLHHSMNALLWHDHGDRGIWPA